MTSVYTSAPADGGILVAVLVLDPNDVPASAPKYEGATAPLPKRVQQFESVPNPEDLLPADAILTSPVAPKFHQTEIRKIQSEALKNTIDNEHVQWTHVALSVKQWEIIEAVVPKIVRNSMLKDYVSGYYLRAPRIPTWK